MQPVSLLQRYANGFGYSKNDPRLVVYGCMLNNLPLPLASGRPGHCDYLISGRRVSVLFLFTPQVLDGLWMKACPPGHESVCHPVRGIYPAAGANRRGRGPAHGLASSRRMQTPAPAQLPVGTPACSQDRFNTKGSLDRGQGQARRYRARRRQDIAHCAGVRGDRGGSTCSTQP